MNKLIRFDPFEEINALTDQFFGNTWPSASKAMSLPTTDVYTKDNNLIVEAHLPNFNEDDVDVEIDNGTLVIQAERHEKDEDKGKRYVMRESSTSFYRRMQLPERADQAKIDADMKNGVLKITIPMTPLPEPKKIKILGQGKK